MKRNFCFDCFNTECQEKRIFPYNLDPIDCENFKEPMTIEELNIKIKELPNNGDISDGYHTFNELYYYRMLYNAAFFNLLAKYNICKIHKSKRHHTKEKCFDGGWFIVMADLPTGQVSNHYELKYWDLFKCNEQKYADEWDGHTPQEAAERFKKYIENYD